ncbi:hypothetical protein ES708_32332 [subsurface metagenome]
MKITMKIQESVLLMDIQLLDHLIAIPEMKYYSMADDGFIVKSENSITSQICKVFSG